jgi:NAD+ diphosphatase
MRDLMEISEAYKFCPLCGVARQEFRPSRPFRCHACGHTSFFGPVSAVGGVIVNESGQVLLIQRARDPGAGKLGMPGGFVDAYETAEASLHREVFEEVGITIEDLKFLMNYPNCYKYQGISCPVLDLFYLARASQSQVVSAAESEVSGWMWTEITPQVLERMAFESNRLALEQYLELGQS